MDESITVYIEPDKYSTSANPNECFHHFCKENTVGDLICCKCGEVLYSRFVMDH